MAEADAARRRLCQGSCKWRHSSLRGAWWRQTLPDGGLYKVSSRRRPTLRRAQSVALTLPSEHIIHSSELHLPRHTRQGTHEACRALGFAGLPAVAPLSCPPMHTSCRPLSSSVLVTVATPLQSQAVAPRGVSVGRARGGTHPSKLHSTRRPTRRSGLALSVRAGTEAVMSWWTSWSPCRRVVVLVLELVVVVALLVLSSLHVLRRTRMMRCPLFSRGPV
jgi:hypothetical protein